uniref:Angiopoietin-like 6 n=1 Tax=Echeneis naucrates TaxID=173247 RepID=A0A665UF94_ECHNA
FWLVCLTLFLTLCLDIPEAGGRKDGASGDNPGDKHSPRSSDTKGGRCSYTFIVPQQKLTGALCLNTQSATTNHSEVAVLRAELKRQQEQLEKLRGQLDQEGALALEIRALRKESNSMNSRIAQLYAQLLNEVLQKKDQALEQRRVENLLLNATTQALQVSSNYRELEKKYGALTSTMSSQNQFIARLEKQCQCRDSTHQSSLVGNKLQCECLKITPEIQEGTENDLLLLFALPLTPNSGPWRDCQHVLESGETISGIYLLRPQSANRLMQAWCEQSRAQGGWTVIQRRLDGSVNFFRTWEQYKQGFGNLDGEYWLGLEHLYWLTKQAQYKLRVALEDWQGRQVFAEYDSFRLEPETDWYRLRLGQYQGTAGDSLSWHNNKAFTTLDRDKDSYTGNCAHFQKGGWWYHMCAHSNLNGVWYRGGHYRSRYQDGVYWAEFHGGSYSLKRVSMMIKPT